MLIFSKYLSMKTSKGKRESTDRDVILQFKSIAP